MPHATNPANYPAIQQWEEAGASLLNALEKYSEHCTTLGKEYLAVGVPPKFLAARIEDVLGSLHSQLAQLRSTLAQTCNMAVVPLHSLPEEVLSNIFAHVVFASLDRFRGNDPHSMGECVISSHRALHNLFDVCTLWRNVLINRGILWSAIPLSDKVKIPPGYRSILDRVLYQNKDVGLNLIASMCHDKTDISTLSTHVPKFRAVNIVDASAPMIQTILAAFTNWSEPDLLSLTQLSVTHRGVYHTNAPDGVQLFPGISEQQPFNRLVKHLTSLQMKGTLLHWGAVAFSDRLTSFHLRDVKLGSDSELVSLLSAVSSATQLRELQIIMVETYESPTPLPSLLERSRTWLPNLESLTIEHLYFNTLRLLLLSIQSRSHRLTLGLSHRSKTIIRLRSEDKEHVHFSNLLELLTPVPVHSLGVDLRPIEPVVSPADLRVLVNTLLPLTTLRLTTLLLSADYCMALKRPRELRGSTFPTFVNFYIFYSFFPETGPFKWMVNSHSSSLKWLELAEIRSQNCSDDRLRPLLGKEEELDDWLRENVPEYTRRSVVYEHPDLRLFL